MNQTGKVTLLGLIFLMVVFYGGFVAVKVMSLSLTQSQIKSDVRALVNTIADPKLTEMKGEQYIRNLLATKNIIFNDDHEVILKRSDDGKEIEFYFEYEVSMNLFLFMTEPKLVQVEDSVSAY